MALIGRAVIWIILTFIVHLITRQFYDWPARSDIVVFRIVLCVIAGILLILVWRQYSKMSACQTRAEMAMNPARFSPDKIDCYVRFQGELTTGDTYTLPISGNACAFYHAEIFAEWETKAKKPAKGMETQRKPLLRDQSSADMEIAVGEQRVYVRPEYFIRNWQLRESQRTQRECPAQIRHLADRKYQTYKITEYFAYKGDTIMAQGRLTRHTNGRLFIKPTGRFTYPSFIAIRLQRTGADQFAREVASQAIRDARSKQINIAGLVINALLLLYATLKI